MKDAQIFTNVSVPHAFKVSRIIIRSLVFQLFDIKVKLFQHNFFPGPL